MPSRLKLLKTKGRSYGDKATNDDLKCSFDDLIELDKKNLD